MKRDKVSKNVKSFDKTKYSNMALFGDCDSDIAWGYYTDKDSGLVKYRDFTGVEHKRIQSNINIPELLPSHPQLQSIVKLWSDFKNIMKSICNQEDVMKIEVQAREWVALYANVYLHKNITPYMHVLMNHIPEAMKIHGNLSLLSMQGVEKTNDQVTQWYFRCTNHYSKQSLQQIMQKQSRIVLLSAEYFLTKLNICSTCGEQGHNKRTCHNKQPA